MGKRFLELAPGPFACCPGTAQSQVWHTLRGNNSSSKASALALSFSADPSSSKHSPLVSVPASSALALCFRFLSPLVGNIPQPADRPYATHKDLPCILHISPTPPTRIYCVFCRFLLHPPQGFIVYFVHFSYTPQKDLLCILYISLTPPTRIRAVSTRP